MTDEQRQELGYLLNHVSKQMLVKQELTSDRSGGCWYDVVHDSQDKINKRQKQQHNYQDWYKDNHDWKDDDDYQRAMNMSDDELEKYGVYGKKNYEENKEEQKLCDFSFRHPILGKLLYGI